MSRYAGRILMVAATVLLACQVADAQTGQVQLGWDAIDPNVTDLAGYRLHYDADPNIFNLTPSLARAGGASFVEVDANTTMAIVSNLGTATTFFFAVTAFDLSGNESGFSGVVSSTGFSIPTVRSLSPNSAQQGDSAIDVTVLGDNFTASSLIDFGDPNEISVNSVNTSGAPGSLVANITIASLARVAARTVTVMNPGGGTGSKSSAFTVEVDIARVDIDGSNRIDNGDFVQILLGYPSAAGDSAYSPAIDLDSDGLVNGADLGILFTYFGLMAPFP